MNNCKKDTTIIKIKSPRFNKFKLDGEGVNKVLECNNLILVPTGSRAISPLTINPTMQHAKASKQIKH